MLWLGNKLSHDKDEKQPNGSLQALSPEQMTFVEIYEAYKELKIFFVSHVEQHVGNSLKALRRAVAHNDDLPTALPNYDPDTDQLIIRQEIYAHGYGIGRSPNFLLEKRFTLTPSFSNQVSIARSFLHTFEKYAWFKMDAETKSHLQAIISFSEEIPPRLKYKDDLPAVLGILENLSVFTYAYLPEHKTYMEQSALEKLQMEGAECLREFVKQVNDLTPYSFPRKEKEAPKEKQLTLREKLQGLFHSNVFVRFTVWCVLILIITSISVLIFKRYLNLTPDTMATVVIGTSVASAAALAVFDKGPQK